MKKWLWYLLALASLPLLGFGNLGGQDVGELQPVKVILAEKKNGQLRLLTDSEDEGWGKTPEQAVKSVNASASRKIFLDTAQVLLLREGAEEYLDDLMAYLRPSCGVCVATGEVDLKKAGEYLQLHTPDLTLCGYEAGERKLPRYISEGGKQQLVQ